jgi:hypothetical protein
MKLEINFNFPSFCVIAIDCPISYDVNSFFQVLVLGLSGWISYAIIRESEKSKVEMTFLSFFCGNVQSTIGKLEAMFFRYCTPINRCAGNV